MSLPFGIGYAVALLKHLGAKWLSAMQDANGAESVFHMHLGQVYHRAGGPKPKIVDSEEMIGCRGLVACFVLLTHRTADMSIRDIIPIFTTTPCSE